MNWLLRTYARRSRHALYTACSNPLATQAEPDNYTALMKLIKLFRQSGRSAEIPLFLQLAQLHQPRALSHPGFNTCLGLNARFSNQPELVGNKSQLLLHDKRRQCGVSMLHDMTLLGARKRSRT